MSTSDHTLPAPGQQILSGGHDWAWAFVIYRDAPGWPGYLVGSDGSIWSRKQGDWKKRRTHSRNCFGHQKVTMYRAGKWFHPSVHRLVALAFLGDPGDGRECRHLNGDPTDNRAENLAWGTASQNQRDRLAHGTDCRGVNHHGVKLVPAQVQAIRDADLRLIRRRDLASLYGVSESTIKSIRRGDNWGWMS